MRKLKVEAMDGLARLDGKSLARLAPVTQPRI